MLNVAVKKFIKTKFRLEYLNFIDPIGYAERVLSPAQWQYPNQPLTLALDEGQVTTSQLGWIQQKILKNFSNNQRKFL